MFSHDLASGLFGNPYGMMGGLPGSRFESPFSSLMGRAPARPAMILPLMFGLFPMNGTEPAAETTEKRAEENANAVPQDAGEEFKAKRELSMLRAQLEQAVRAEEFEKAAELRDKIRGME
jgi:hypothetical protein